MPAHRPAESRYCCVAMYEAGWSERKIANQLKVPRSTVHRWIERFRRSGAVERLTGTGGARVTSWEDDQRLVELMESNKFATASSVLAEWKKPVSVSTVRRRIRRLKNLVDNPVEPPFEMVLTSAHRSARLKWGTDHLDFRANQWKDVVFTDSTMFRLRAPDGRTRVWRAQGEENQLSDSFMRNLVINSLHIWGAISVGGRPQLAILPESLTSDTYKPLLQEKLLPWAVKDIGQPDTDWYLQEDDTASYRSKAIEEFKQEVGIRNFPWPSKSPDLNPLVTVWDTLDKMVAERHTKLSNLQELASALQEEWNKIPEGFIVSLYASMPERVEALVKANGCVIFK